MPSKRPPSKQLSADLSSAAANKLGADSQPSSAQPQPAAVTPAPKRFKVAVLLFAAWLMFLIYLAFLTWTGK